RPAPGGRRSVPRRRHPAAHGAGLGRPSEARFHPQARRPGRVEHRHQAAGPEGRPMTKIVALLIVLGAVAAGTATSPPVRVAPEKMPRIATVSDRYQSYNIEMAELTGGQ